MFVGNVTEMNIYKKKNILKISLFIFFLFPGSKERSSEQSSQNYYNV